MYNAAKLGFELAPDLQNDVNIKHFRKNLRASSRESSTSTANHDIAVFIYSSTY